MKIDTAKLYTAEQIIKKIGLRRFQDLKTNGRLNWRADNTKGEKLYKLNY